MTWSREALKLGFREYLMLLGEMHGWSRDQSMEYVLTRSARSRSAVNCWTSMGEAHSPIPWPLLDLLRVELLLDCLEERKRLDVDVFKPFMASRDQI